MRILIKTIRLFGAGLRNGFVAIGALAFLGTVISFANYTVTQGSGTTFASLVISTVHYAAHVLCDATVGQTQCAAVDSHGQLQIDVGTSNNNLYAAVTAGAATNGSTYPSSSLGIGTKDPSGNIQPISAAVPVPIALSGLCSGCTASQGSATGTTAATSTTLPAVASVTQYVCGISIRANATAAATGNATLSDGTITLNFTQWTAPTASGVGIIEEQFLPCRPASAVNTAWTLTSAAPGTGGVVSASIWGYNK